MKKLFLKDIEDIKERNRIIKLNKKLIDELQDDLYQNNLDLQYIDSEYMLGKNNGIHYHDNYTSFYCTLDTLNDCNKFIWAIDSDYLDEKHLTIYNKATTLYEKQYNVEYCSKNWDRITDRFMELCDQLLKYYEDILHEYEIYPSKDEAIEYADEMERLDDYYIETDDNNNSDNVIRRDVAFTETYT